jgi:hypothetical protein
MKWIILALCVLGLGCQKTIHEARSNTPTPTSAVALHHC